MSVDYDIVVIGMSAHAQKLVSLAVQREARVAWVWDQEFCDQYSNAYLNIDQIDHILLLLQNKLISMLALGQTSLLFLYK
jgi:hypothetical protein